MSTAPPYFSKHYVFKTKTAQLLAKLFGENDNLVKNFDKEKLKFIQKI